MKLAPSDFTATSGTNIVLGSAASTGDTVAIVGYGTFVYLATIQDRGQSFIDDVSNIGRNIKWQLTHQRLKQT